MKFDFSKSPNIYKNLLIYIGLIDEQFSRICTIGRVAVFKEAVNATIDISGLQNRINHFGTFVNKFLDELISNPEKYHKDEVEYLLKEVNWSLSQSNSFIDMLEKIKGKYSDVQAVTDPRTLASLLLYRTSLNSIKRKLETLV